jgi:hypothetical protein
MFVPPDHRDSTPGGAPFGAESLLLTVSDVFAIRGGVVLDPEFDHPTAWGQLPVVLRSPDGSERAASASVEVPFINRHPYVSPRKVCLIRGMGKTEVPIGTEIWLVKPPAAHC